MQDINQVRIKTLLEQQKAFKKELVAQQKEIRRLKAMLKKHKIDYEQDTTRPESKWD